MARRAARAATSRLSEEELNRIWKKPQAGLDSLPKEFPCITWKNRKKHLLEMYGPKVIENTRRQSELLYKTDWFDAGPWNAWDLLPEVGSSGFSEVTPNVEAAAKSAIRTLNKQLAKEKKERVRVQEIIRVTWQPVRGLIYFITIKASDGNFYEAKVHHDIDKQYDTLLMRIAKHYPVTDPEVLQLKMSGAEAGSSAGLGASRSGRGRGRGRGRQPRG